MKCIFSCFFHFNLNPSYLASYCDEIFHRHIARHAEASSINFELQSFYETLSLSSGKLKRDISMRQFNFYYHELHFAPLVFSGNIIIIIFYIYAIISLPPCEVSGKKIALRINERISSKKHILNANFTR